MAEPKPADSKTGESDLTLPKTLLWLWDAPLFIDEVQIGRFYDAVVRPESKAGKATISLAKMNTHKAAAKLGVKAGLSLGAFGRIISQFIKPEFNVIGEGGYEWAAQNTSTEAIELHEISTPERQLIQLTGHYILSNPDRLLLVEVEEMAKEDWRTPDVIAAVPRALAFLDLPGRHEAHAFGLPETKIIPTAAEFD
jgi:hypothetical protein